MPQAPARPPRPSADGTGDGFPTVPELLRALRLLQIPVDQERLALRALGPERQRSVLFALLATWAEVYVWSWRAQGDTTDTSTHHAILATADQQVAPGSRVVLQNLIKVRSERMHAAGFQAGEEPDPFNLGGVICALTRAAGRSADAWTWPYSPEATQVLGPLAGSADRGAGTVPALRLAPDIEFLRAARKEALAALEEIDTVLAVHPDAASPE